MTKPTFDMGAASYQQVGIDKQASLTDNEFAFTLFDQISYKRLAKLVNLE